MKAETNKEIHLDNSRIPAYEIVLRCKNSVLDPGDKDLDENKNDGKSKSGVQLEKQTKHDRKEESDEEEDEEEEEEEKENLELVTLVEELKQKCRVIEDMASDVISRSPMRTQDCNHYCKPYVYPHNTSRAFGGVTRVVEMDRRCHYPIMPFPHDFGHANDVNLCDVGQWLNLCKKDPKFLQQFLMDCKNELSAKEISRLQEYRNSKLECSSPSGQFTSPAQSPSEQNLTSPESVTYEESSLYSISPNIPSLDAINIKPSEDDERTSPTTRNGKVPLELNVSSTPNSNEYNYLDSLRPPQEFGTTSSNIGTVMLKLAEDPYESTIDLNQFATACNTHDRMIPTPERDTLNDKLDSKAKENAWTRISQVNLDLLGKGDKDGDTQLMILLVSETEKILEYVYVIVERLLKEKPEYLSLRNELNQDALYLASFKLPWEPLVASYIAEALVRGKQDVNLKYDEGNTLLHCLAKQGDSHAKVLEKLLKLRHSNSIPVFDVNKKNNRGFTPLHIACETHRREVVHAYQTVRILVENGANLRAKEYKDENTPIHTLINESCDVELLRVVLETAGKVEDADGTSPTAVANRQGNTALHLACSRNTLRLSHQKEAIGILLRHGAMIQLKNINGCVPAVLVDSTRKQEIKTILHSFRQKY